jgi:hypothetical protein
MDWINEDFHSIKLRSSLINSLCIGAFRYLEIENNDEMIMMLIEEQKTGRAR